MRKLIFTIFIACSILATTNVKAQLASIQFIHNSADPANAQIDVYLDGVRILNDFSFRTGTPFVSYTAGNHRIAIAPSNSINESDSIYSLNEVFIANENTGLMLLGVNDPSKFIGILNYDINLRIIKLSDLPKTGVAGRATLSLVHGTTDLKPFSVYGKSIKDPYVAFLDDIKYGELKGTFAPKALANYRFEIRNQNNFADKEYIANLNNYDGQVGIMFTSGFVTRNNNQTYNSFIYIVWASGQVVQLTRVPTARVIVINNSADTSYNFSNVYFDNFTRIDDLKFREQSGETTVPSGISRVSVGQKGKEFPDSTFSKNMNLDSNTLYYFVISGVNNSANYKSNPDGVNTKIQIYTYKNPRRISNVLNNKDVIFFNGSTDLAGIDLYLRPNLAPTFSGINYGQFSNYQTITPKPYNVDLTTKGDKNNELRSFRWNIALNDTTPGILLTSGFLDSSSANRNGPGLNLVYFGGTGPGLVLPRTGVRTGILSNTMTKTEILVYPNPSTTGFINVGIPRLTQPTNMFVFDIQGRAVYSLLDVQNQSTTKLTIPTHNFKAGVYYIQFNGGLISTEKVVVK
ncbi:MAG: DUF4397 domain-containing protein [Bacteroidota bacterium]|nr:DUF4397 domain-containing protein [Bacteroidota bacterium]